MTETNLNAIYKKVLDNSGEVKTINETLSNSTVKLPCLSFESYNQCVSRVSDKLLFLQLN